MRGADRQEHRAHFLFESHCHERRCQSCSAWAKPRDMRNRVGCTCEQKREWHPKVDTEGRAGEEDKPPPEGSANSHRSCWLQFRFPNELEASSRDGHCGIRGARSSFHAIPSDRFFPFLAFFDGSLLGGSNFRITLGACGVGIVRGMSRACKKFGIAA